MTEERTLRKTRVGIVESAKMDKTVVIAIEEFFSIQFDDVGFGDFQTVGDVITYIEGKVNQ